jgi:hypothetical protein
MVGMSKEQILKCMGPPASKAAEGQTEVWGYNSGDGTVVASGSVSGGKLLRGIVEKILPNQFDLLWWCREYCQLSRSDGRPDHGRRAVRICCRRMRQTQIAAK